GRPVHSHVSVEYSEKDEFLACKEDRGPGPVEVPRELSRDTLAPSDRALRLGAAEHASHVGLARTARLVRVLQRKPYDKQLDAFESHCSSVSSVRSRRGWGTRRYAPRPSAARRNSTAA